MSLCNIFLTSVFYVEMLFPALPGQKLHRMCLCAEPPGDHSADRGPAQSAPAGDCQNLPEWERLRCVWEVWSNLQHAHPIPHIPLHCNPYNSMCPAISSHSDTQVRTWWCFVSARYHQCLSSLCIFQKWIKPLCSLKKWKGWQGWGEIRLCLEYVVDDNPF